MLLFLIDADGPEEGLAGLWLELVGQLHPALTHFPVALLVVAAAVELMAGIGGLFGREASSRPTATGAVCLVFAALGACAATFSGWTLSERIPISERLHDLVELHRWFGVGVAGGALLALVPAFLARGGEARGALRTYRALLLLAAGAVGYAGHLGGSIVHGERALSDPIDALLEHYRGLDGSAPDAPTQTEVGTGVELPVQTDVPPAVVEEPPADPAHLEGDVASLPRAEHDPIEQLSLDARALIGSRCVECHGPARSEAALRLDTYEEIVDLGFSAIPGDPDQSLIVERVELPEDDEERMPTEGPPLTDEEKALLRQWIEVGLPWPSDGEPATE